jgi:hypothetical protein
MQKDVVVVANETEYLEWMKAQSSHYLTVVKPSLDEANAAVQPIAQLTESK